MADVKVTSHGQKGGITAQNVTATSSGQTGAPKDSAWVRWGTIAGVVSAVLAGLTYYIMK